MRVRAGVVWAGLALMGCGGGWSPEAAAPSSARDEASPGTEEAIVLSGGAPSSPMPPPPPPPPGAAMAYPAEAPTQAPAPAKDATGEVRSKEYLVYTAELHLSVYQVEQGLEKIEALARDFSGYLSSRNDHEIVIRVPRERFQEALARVEATGDVLHRNVQAIDVTDEFVDAETRLRNARAMRDRLQALLAKAEVKEAIEIEKELGRVTEQIEVLQGKLKLLSDRIAYSTITVRYSGKGSSSGNPQLRLPFPWLHSLGIHRLMNFR